MTISACVKAVDESVGRLLKFLDDAGLAQNTIVVYASDQGFYLGEHGWFDKRWIFEESLRDARCSSDGRAWRRPGLVDRSASCRTSTSPPPSSTPPACRSPPEIQGRSLVTAP